MRQQTSSYVGSLWEVRCDAEQQLLALARVVKVPSGIDKETEQNLSQAAWDSMELDNENIVRVADVVFGTGWFAVVHDHYDGDTVRTMQRRVAERKSAVPVPVAVRIVLDTLEALRKVHELVEELGVSVSPAIDPGSLLVCDDGRTRLLDGFVGGYVPNVPKMARDDETFAYAAPEMFDNSAASDECTQVFRVAVIAWELLCSKRLLVGSKAVIQRRLQTAIVRADRVNRVGVGASEQLALVFEKALKVDRSQRYATLAEFEKAVRAAAGTVGTQEEVIAFADALVGRESTLARLVMDKPQRLSDAMKSIRPTADVTKSFAARVMGGTAQPKQETIVAAAAKTPHKAPSVVGKPATDATARVFGKTMPLAAAPDALFSAPRAARAVPGAALPPVAAPAPAPAPAPAAARAATAAQQPTAIAARASRQEPTVPARRAGAAVAAAPKAVAPVPMAPAPVARVAAPMVAGTTDPTAPPRQRFKTLVGLFPEDFGPGGAAAETSPAEDDEDSLPIAASAVMATATPASRVAAVERTVDDDWSGDAEDDGDGDTEKIDVGDELADDDELASGDTDEMDVAETDLDAEDPLDDVPTQAYNVAQFAAVAREARNKLESGPRLASKPPPASADPFLPAEAAKSPWQAGTNAPATAPEEPYEHESTLPAAQAIPLPAQAPASTAIAAAIAVAVAPAANAPQSAATPPQTWAIPQTPAQTAAAAPAPAPAQAPAVAAKPERRLLMLTMFFAGTTFALAVVALGLLVRSESAEQSASALAGAPVTAAAQSAAPPAAAPVAAPPADPVAPTQAAPEAAQAPAPEPAEPAPEPEAEPAAAEAAPAAESPGQAEAAAPLEPAAALAPAAAQAAPAPAPRAVRRAAPRKTKVSSPRYVPSDI